MFMLSLRAGGCSDEYCSGQPRACPVATPTLGSVHPESEAQRQTFHITYRNAATSLVMLEWLAANGTVGSILARIRPGAHAVISATTGDAFRATDVEGALLMEMTTGPVVVRDCERCRDEPLVLCPPRTPARHNATQRPQYEPAGFYNAATLPVDVFMYGGQCEHLLTANEPLGARGGQRHFASWAGQRFRVRTRSEQQRLLLEYTVGEVLVRPCNGGGSGVGVGGSSTQVVELQTQVAALEARLAELHEHTNKHVLALQAAVRQIFNLTRSVQAEAEQRELSHEGHTRHLLERVAALERGLVVGEGQPTDPQAAEESEGGEVPSSQFERQRVDAFGNVVQVEHEPDAEPPPRLSTYEQRLDTA